MVKIKYCEHITEPYWVYNFDTNEHFLELPIGYFKDEAKSTELLQRAIKEFEKRGL